jgi:DNA-binding LacI/PurR family transcriptional regulator
MSSGRTVRIGVLIPQLEDRYHSRISDQILRFFDGSGVEVFIFVGRTLRSTRNNQNQANYIYRMASASRLDGLLVVASSLANDLPAGEFLPFLDRYAPLPIVLHGWHHPRHPGVMIDNRSGMKELMEHFIKVHGMRQIAFLSGPPHNQDAAERLESYRRALEDAGIAYDPRLVVEGGFNYQYGRSAVRELLDGRGLLPRVIVAANDEMALAVSDELQERGIAVPDQVALGGFDNIQETEFRIPPITTVEQPLEQVTRTACQLLLDLVDGKPVPVYSLLPTRLVVRQSCGCSFHPLQQGPSAQPAVRQDGDGHHALDQVLFAALRERFEPVRPEWPLMEPVIRDLLGRVRSLRRSRETPQALIQAAQGWFFQRFRMGVSFSVWKLVLQEMQLILDALGFGQFGDRSWLGLVFRELFILVQELVLLEYKI